MIGRRLGLSLDNEGVAAPQEVWEFRNRIWRPGPVWLFLAWVLHDLEEVVAFPATCDYLAGRTGIDGLRMDSRQSWAAVGLMGVFVGFACVRGARTAGSSRLYQAVVAGLGAHVGTHVGATLLTRRYMAGGVTAVSVMLPGVIVAGRELAYSGMPLQVRDWALGAILLLPAAVLCHVIVRVVVRRGVH